MKFAKGHNSVKNVDGVMFLVFSTCPLMMFYICTKCHENILDSNKVIEQTRFSFEIFQRRIISQGGWSYSSCSLHIF